MKNFKARYALLVVALIAIFGFTACGQPTDNGITPIAADFDISTPSRKVADGSPKMVIITPRAGKSTGAITIYYEGTGGTTYPRSTDAPTAAGKYLVTFDVAAADGFNAAFGLIAGTLTIDKAGTVIIEKDDKVGTLTGGPLVHEYEIRAANTRYVEDTALIHLINDAMLYYTKSYDVTLTGTAPLSPTANALPGDLTFDNMADIYTYDNTLYVVEMTGSQFKQWMEWAHWDYHRTNMKAGDLTIPYGGGTGYNFDQFDGLTYEVDISKDRGQRIVNMKNPDGSAFDLTKTYRVAINNYRQQYLTSTVGVSGTVKTIAANVDSTLTVDGETITNSRGMKGLLADYIERVKNGIITNEFTPSWKFIIPGENEAWYPAYRAKAVELLNNGMLTFSATRPVTITDVKDFIPDSNPQPPSDLFPPPKAPVQAPLTVDFEDAAWGADNYSERAVLIGNVEWTVSGIVNPDGSDHFVGTRSIRLRGQSGDNCRVELMDYLTTGIKTVSFDYASYGTHSNGTIVLYYHIKGSSSWTKAGEVTASKWSDDNPVMSPASFNINITSPVRIRIVREGGLANYTSVNIDNINITN